MKKDGIKVFITGASGIIGKAILQDISGQGLPLREIVALERDKTLNSADIRTIKGDIRELSDAMIRELEDTDILVHLAALVHKPGTSSKLYEQVNDRATRRLIDAFREVSKSTIKQFIFISTVLVFGNYKSEAYLEEDETNPDTPYGISKLEAEKYIGKTAGIDSSFKYTILRLTPVYGEGDKGNVGRMIRFVKRFRCFPIFGENVKKCPVYVEDVSKSIISCINNEKAFDETFIISGPPISMEEMAVDIGYQLGINVRLFRAPTLFLDGMSAVKKLMRTDIYSNRKASEVLSYNPCFFREGLEGMKRKGVL